MRATHYAILKLNYRLPTNLSIDFPFGWRGTLIIEFGLRNFFSFKEGAVLSFRFDGNTPENISRGQPYATVMGINGANAAGKTQLLKGLNFVNFFAARSFAWKPNALLPLEPFGNGKDASEFYIEFIAGDLIYRYEFEVTEHEVVREALFRTKSKKTLLFERKKNTVVKSVKELEAISSLTLRSNVSLIATVNQYQLPLLEDVFDVLNQIQTNVAYSGLHDPLMDINATAKLLNEAPYALAFVENFIRNCDTGVSKIVIKHREGGNNEKIFFPVFLHQIDNEDYAVSALGESSGTKRLFQTLPDYALALMTGGVLVVDELDIHLHPHILPNLLALFTDPAMNPRHAQLIFTSHNVKIMDALGKYRSCVVAKKDNESFVFRLDEVPGDMLRNDRSIANVYDDGKIGGVPRL
ncbi:ATP-binding protein [Pararobbsia silviterrae]|uniref:ATP-binding protein n=1 Tax=Pararobbsia silviterrae TaxID=1792498 RepID=A0A494XWE7_9BURK|nr:ATP-binding protein [Pararobbsia silviterrae]